MLAGSESLYNCHFGPFPGNRFSCACMVNWFHYTKGLSLMVNNYAGQVSKMSCNGQRRRLITFHLQ